MNLKEELKPIVLDETLTKAERGLKFIPLMKKLAASVNDDHVKAAEIWNNTMAEIVKEHNLARH